MFFRTQKKTQVSLNMHSLETLLIKHTPIHSSKQLSISKLPKLYHNDAADILLKAKLTASKYNVITDNYTGHMKQMLYLFPYTNNHDALIDLTNLMNWAYTLDDLNDILTDKTSSKFRDFIIKRIQEAWIYGTTDNITEWSFHSGNYVHYLSKLRVVCRFAVYLRNRLLLHMPKEYYFSYIWNIYKWYSIELCKKKQNKITSTKQLLEHKINIQGMNYLLQYSFQYLNNWYFDIDRTMNKLNYNHFMKVYKKYKYYISMIACLSNDLFSFPKETIGYDNTSYANYLRYAIIENNYNLNAAIKQLISLTNDAYTHSQILFKDLLNIINGLDKLSHYNQEKLREFIIAINKQINGYYYFQAESKRYLHKYHIFVDMITDFDNVNHTIVCKL
eukprot:170513_1